MSTWWFVRGHLVEAAERLGPSAIGCSCASSTNSGSTRKVIVVRMPSAPRPTRATSRTSAFSSRVGAEHLAVAGDQLEAGHLRASPAATPAGAVGAGARWRRPGSARRCRPCCAATGRAARGSAFSSLQRRAGQRGDGHRVAVDARRCRVSPPGREHGALGGRDRGEAVAGADHLHGAAGVARPRHRVDHVAGVGRRGLTASGAPSARPDQFVHVAHGGSLGLTGGAPRRVAHCAASTATSPAEAGTTVRRGRAVRVDHQAGQRGARGDAGAPSRSAGSPCPR